ncbi:MAG: DNA-directed RNA polymerase subunit omega [Bacteroidales bacterium]|jgi:mannitol-specific phosphotransferase system IIBC component|nr:DNA-directed RNA polymerase subunit omega [Bacteroidales bacterium]
MNNEISRDAVTRDIQNFDKGTGNIYKTVAILAKRANQLTSKEKLDIKEKMNEYNNIVSVPSDDTDEVFLNKNLLDLAKYHEQMPKSTILAIQEYLDNDIYFQDPEKE